MIRPGLAALALASLTGCLTFDPYFFNARRVDQYAIDYDIVPAELVREVAFESSDGTLLYGVWAHQPVPAPPLVFFHGNYSDLGAHWERVEYYWGWGEHDVFVFDYRGFGKSEGDATYDGVLEEDGLAAVTYAAAESGYDAERIDWIAHSLGAAVAIHTADEIEAKSIVLENAFASAEALAADNTGLDVPAGWFFEDPFDNVAAIAAVTAPKLIVHGADDDYIRAEYAEQLYEAAPDPKELWQPDGVGHSDVWETIPDEYRDRVLTFQSSWP